MRARCATLLAWLAAGSFLLSSTDAMAQDAMPAGFVDAANVIPGLVVDIRYYGADNFVGRRIPGYDAPRCLLTQTAAEALARVQRDLAARNLGLKAFDCYRPARAVSAFERWAADPSDQTRKRDYYPEIDKRDLFRLGYVGKNSRHSRGSTVDVTLVDLATTREREMGTSFDFMSPKSGDGHRSLSAEARANRALLRAVMTKHGFESYSKEWWHFFLRDEPFPNTSFDFVIARPN